MRMIIIIKKKEKTMADCECLPTCPFFNDKMADKPAMADLLKSKYCRGDSSQCARHMVFEKLGKEAVPPDLFPSQHDRAQTILTAS